MKATKLERDAKSMNEILAKIEKQTGFKYGETMNPKGIRKRFGFECFNVYLDEVADISSPKLKALERICGDHESNAVLSVEPNGYAIVLLRLNPARNYAKY